MGRKSKYSALGKRLADSGLERVRLTYEEMDALCGLPETAYRDRPFWANTKRSPHGSEWLQVGYVVESVSLGHYVEFVHDPERAKEPGRGRKSGRRRERGRAAAGGRATTSAPKFQVDILRPCADEVEKYLREWDKLEGYPEQEAALDDLFLRHCPQNKALSDILLKCAALNTFYSTNIYSITPVARHILELDIDQRLSAGDLKLVDEVQRVTIGGKEMHFYSFATKYCSHHQPGAFPIFDSYVEKMLCYFRDVDGFFGFRDNELKNYPFFKSVLMRFQAAYGLEKYSVKDIDKYLWQLGKTYFPNQYY